MKHKRLLWTIKCLLWIVCLGMTGSVTLTYAESCSVNKFGNFSRSDFATLSCSYCFVVVFINKKRLTLDVKSVVKRTQLNLVWKDNRSRFLRPDALDDNSLVCRKFLTDEECGKWRLCCQAALDCCNGPMQIKNKFSSEPSCSATWDGASCWGHTVGGVTVKQTCPEYYRGVGMEYLRTFRSTKICDANGRWQVTTQYQGCFTAGGELKLILMVAVYVGFGCNLISMLALVLAAFAYIYLKGLRKDESSRFRVRLHLSLFMSFFLLHLVLTIWEPVFYLDGLVNSSSSRYNQNSVGCRFLHSLLWYTRGATYWCLLCESIYLHQKIHAWSISNVTESVKKYFVIGWIIPILPVVAWIVAKVQLDNNKCWMRSHVGHKNINLIVQLPNILTLLINLILMCNVQRILLTTMRGHVHDGDVMVLKRVLRATSAMIPMCGLQMLFLMYRPENWWPYDIIENVTVGTQGLFVSIFYCFINKEVRNEVRSACREQQRHRRGWDRSSISQSANTYSTRLSSDADRNGSIHLKPPVNGNGLDNISENEDYLNAYSTSPMQPQKNGQSTQNVVMR